MMGLLYRYVKVILNNLKPKNQEPGEIIRMLRNINQQSHAFTREVQESFVKSKKDLSQYIPALKNNYLEERLNKLDDVLKINNIIDKNTQSKIKEKPKETNGISLFEISLIERRKIIEKKKETQASKRNLY